MGHNKNVKVKISENHQYKNTTNMVQLTFHPGLGAKAAATIELAFPYKTKNHQNPPVRIQTTTKSELYFQMKKNLFLTPP